MVFPTRMSGRITTFLLLSCLFGLLVAQVVSSSCPLDCNNHGTCNSDGTCTCDQYHVGEDCSVSSQEIRTNKAYSGTVTNRMWTYYRLPTTSPETITWTMTLEVEDTDCDLFVNKDEYPAFTDYIARNISVLPELTITLEDAEPATYIAGVYGFGDKDCEFQIKAEFSSPCPNDCNNHGSCSKGVCSCHSGFMGEECEVTIVTPGETYSGFVEDLFSWNYFAFKSEQLYDEIEWILTPIDSNDHNCEMLTATDFQPNLFEYEETEFSFSTDPISIVNTEVEAGKTYYMSVNGMFGFVACNYSATLVVTAPGSPTECPNNCSYHASNYHCKDNTCKCKSGYEGPECEEYTKEMIDGKRYPGYVGEGAWNYFHFTVESENPVTVLLDRTSDEGDLDLYVNADGKPALFNYSYCDVNTGTRMQVKIFEPLGHTWYIGVFGWHAANYSMKIMETSKCPCIDSRHGECLYNPEICYCNEGYAGSDCAAPLLSLESGKPLMDQRVEMDKWVYYEISGEGASAVSLTVREHGEVATTWVYVSPETFPTTTEFAYSDRNRHNNTHQISYHTNAEQSGLLWIGVYGSPFIPEVDGGESVEFDIVCWVSSF